MIQRLLRVATALSIFLSAFGLAPTEAAAQFFAARAAAGSASSAAGAAASVSASAIRPLALPAAALGTAALAAPSALMGPSAAAAPSAAALAPAAVAAILPASVISAAPVAPAPAAPAAIPSASRSLSEGAARLAAGAPSDAAAKSAELDRLFLAVPMRSGAEAVAPALESRTSRFLKAAAAGPRWVFRPQAPAPSQPAPRTTLKRSLAVGYLTGLAGMLFTGVATAVVGALGWVPHGNYEMPFDTEHLTVAAAVAMLIGGAVMAPMAEEVIFRGALQGGLSRLSAKLRAGAFVIPAVLTSLIFVAVHETADPVLFAVRFGFAFMLSRVFHKEGILSSMTAHGTFNAVAMSGLVLTAAHVSGLGVLGLFGLGLYGAYKAIRELRAEKPEIAAGTLAPKPFTARHALIILPALLAGFLFVMPNVFWVVGMGLLILWLAARAAGFFRP